MNTTQKPVAIVTGASSGIGLGITLALIKYGYNLVETARTISTSKELEASLNRDHSAIHHQLGAGDKAAVIGGQKDDGFGDLIGLTHPAKRDLGCHLRSELRDLLFVAQVSISWQNQDRSYRQ
jgi:NAD(P)-dependent dehydrogenase (short-subunit alcohol dehydrogenase family)